MSLLATPATNWIELRWHRRARKRVRDQYPAAALTFYADGPLWDNALLLPAYPEGYSYFRPFRYRDKWVADDVRAAMVEEPAGFCGLTVALGLRFRDPAHGFIPLREGTITHVEANPDNNYVEFRLGRFYGLPEVEDLAELKVDLPRGADEALFFAGSAVPPERAPCEDPGAEIWTRAVELLAKTRLPIRDEVRSGVFLHVGRSRGWRTHGTGVVDRSWTSGFRHGLRMPEGADREIVVLHRIPKYIGSGGSVNGFDVVIEASNDALVVTPIKESVSANYGRHLLSLSAQRSYNTTTAITIAPEKSGGKPLTEGLSMPRLVLPARVAMGVWHRFWTVLIPTAFLAGAFFANAVIGNWNKFEGDTGMLVGAAAISTVASLFILVFKRPS
jgi:hypothetical protein